MQANDITSIEIKQAEGWPDRLVHAIHSNWDAAAVTLWSICLAKERDSPRRGYWKTDVTIHFNDGSWKRFRFDACKADSAQVHSYEKFAAKTLLWSTSKSHPED